MIRRWSMPAWYMYSTHIPALLWALERTEGAVLELGCGFYSTPLLHSLCNESHRKLVSLESKQSYVDMFSHLRTDDHIIERVSSWDECGRLFSEDWGVVLLDHNPQKSRGPVLRALSDNAEMIVVHDTEPENEHKYDVAGVIQDFKYRLDFNLSKPHTSIVSNTVELDPSRRSV